MCYFKRLVYVYLNNCKMLLNFVEIKSIIFIGYLLFFGIYEVLVLDNYLVI